MAYDEKRPELFSIVAEQAVLGAVLFENAVFGRIADIIGADSFYDPVHRLIFEKCADLIAAGKSAAPTFVDAQLTGVEGYASAGGRKYIETICANVPSIASAADFARLVADYARRRRIAEIARELLASVESGGGDADARKAEERLAEIVAPTTRRGPRTAAQAMADWMAAQTNRQSDLPGLRCGLSSIDEALGGFRRGKLYIVAGRPGMGKSTFLNKLSAGIAETEGAGVAFSTLEMEASELTIMLTTDRMRDHGIRLPYSQAERKMFADDEFEVFGRCAEDVSNLPIIIDDTPRASAAHIRRFAYQARAKFRSMGRPLGAIVVDYLGLIEKNPALMGTEKVAEITASLMAIAAQFDVPVICGCQLNRGVEGRDDKRPLLSDLRESGDIEQDAYSVMLLYRPEYYHGRAEPDASKTEKHEEWFREKMRLATEKPLEVDIAKNRRGATGVVELWAEVETAAIRAKPYDPTLSPHKDRFI